MSDGNRKERGFIDLIGDAICFLDKDRKIISCNTAMEKIAGKDEEQLSGRTLCDIIHQETGQIRNCPVSIMAGSKHREKADVRIKDKWYRLTADPVFDENNELTGAVHIMTDITDQKTAELALLESAALTTIAAEVGFVLTQIDTLENLLQKAAELLVAHLDVAFSRIWVFNPKDNLLVLKASAGIYTHLDGPHGRIPLHADKKIAIIARELKPHLTNQVIGDPKIPDQEWAREKNMVAFAGFPLVVEDKLTGVMAVFSQKPLSEFVLKAMQGIAGGVSSTIKRKQAEEELFFNTYYDGLTGLPNRFLFFDRLKIVMKLARRNKLHSFAVLFFDLDRFKNINEVLGSAVGDELLIGVARRLETCVREFDTIARFNADEFLILLDQLDENKAVMVAQRIQGAIRAAFHIRGNEITIASSIGIVMDSPEYDEPEDMFRNAEVAMNQAKLLASGKYVIFNKIMRVETASFFNMERELRTGLEKNQFELHYQPIVFLHSGKFVGFEALIRWRHPERGLVYPSEFIHVAEETLLILPIGDWVLVEACRQIQDWNERFSPEPPLTMNINLSAKQFLQPDLVRRVKDVIQTSRCEPRMIKLEITESVAMQDFNSTITTLHKLKRLGIQLVIDDFGTGYSSLNYLKQFPVDSLKIDGSFIRRIETNEQNAAIVKSVIGLANNLKIQVVAEGVETAKQVSKLKQLNCKYGQGYYFSKPVDHQAIENLFVKDRKQIFTAPLPEAN